LKNARVNRPREREHMGRSSCFILNPIAHQDRAFAEWTTARTCADQDARQDNPTGKYLDEHDGGVPQRLLPNPPQRRGRS